MHDIVSAMQWRYATKAYDPSKKMSEEDLSTLLEATRLTPASFGLPVWKVIVVESDEIKAKLRESGYGQAQFTDASHIVVFAIENTIDSNLVEQYMELTAKTRDVPREELNGFADMLNGTISSKTPEALSEWAKKQAYIGLGTLLTTAAVMRIDATPMEGFDPNAFDEILELASLDLHSVVACSLGYRTSEDPYAAAPKVRLPMETFAMRN